MGFKKWPPAGDKKQRWRPMTASTEQAKRFRQLQKAFASSTHTHTTVPLGEIDSFLCTSMSQDKTSVKTLSKKKYVSIARSFDKVHVKCKRTAVSTVLLLMV